MGGPIGRVRPCGCRPGARPRSAHPVSPEVSTQDTRHTTRRAGSAAAHCSRVPRETPGTSGGFRRRALRPSVAVVQHTGDPVERPPAGTSRRSSPPTARWPRSTAAPTLGRSSCPPWSIAGFTWNTLDDSGRPDRRARAVTHRRPSDVKHAMCSRRPIAARRMVRSRASCGPVRLRVARGRQPAVVGHVSCCAPRSSTDPRAASGRQRLAARARRHPQPNAPSAWFHAPHRWGDTVQTCGRPPWTGRERSPRGRGASQFDVICPGGLRVSRTARAGTHAIGHCVARACSTARALDFGTCPGVSLIWSADAAPPREICSPSARWRTGWRGGVVFS